MLEGVGATAVQISPKERQNRKHLTPDERHRDKVRTQLEAEWGIRYSALLNHTRHTLNLPDNWFQQRSPRGHLNGDDLITIRFLARVALTTSWLPSVVDDHLPIRRYDDLTELVQDAITAIGGIDKTAQLLGRGLITL